MIDDQLKGASCSSAIEAASSEGCVGRSSLVNDQVFDSVWKEGRKEVLINVKVQQAQAFLPPHPPRMAAVH